MPLITARRWALLLLGLFLVAGCRAAPAGAPTPSPTPPPPQSPGDALYVDAAYSLGTIPPTVYGTNYGPWISVPLEVQEAFEQSQIRLLRFPGGEYGDKQNLRPAQIDQFIELAKRIDAEPMISVRLIGGTPEQAVALLRYTNIEKDYGVRYWSIGNEPTLYATAYRAPEWDTTYYNARWREFALALKEVDPDILLFGPDVNQFTPDPKGSDWMDAFLEANGDLVDVVSIHRYPFPRSANAPQTTISELRATSAEWDTTIPFLRQLIHEKTGRELPIAVTEINSDWSKAINGPATPDSFFNAIWWGDVLGRLIRNDVDYVAHFALQTNPRQGGWGLLARDEVRPSYYVYQMYAQFGDQLRFAASPFEEVSLFAALKGEDTLTLMLVNLSDEEQTLPLQLDHFAPAGNAALWRFDASHNATRLEDVPVAAGMPLTLPAQSMTLYAIPGEVNP